MSLKEHEIRDYMTQMTDLLIEKNKHYRDAYTITGEVLSLLYPNGIRPDQFHNMLLICRIIDKLCRISSEHYSTDVESPFRDITGYGVLGSLQEVRRESDGVTTQSETGGATNSG